MLAALVAAAVASAAPAPPAPVAPPPAATAPATSAGLAMFDPMTVARFVESLRDNIRLATYADGTPLARETPAERKLPILPPDIAKRVLDRGALSGMTEVCGGDWRTMSFDPLMDGLRTRGLTPKQLAFAAALHDSSKQIGPDLVPEGCDAGIKARVAELLAAERARG